MLCMLWQTKNTATMRYHGTSTGDGTDMDRDLQCRLCEPLGSTFKYMHVYPDSLGSLGAAAATFIEVFSEEDCQTGSEKLTTCYYFHIPRY